MKAAQFCILFILTMSLVPAHSQIDLREDNYILRSDTGLNYFLYVRNNDTPFLGIKIFGLNKIGASAGLYTAAIIDSNFIIIASNTPDTFSGALTYKGRNNLGALDSATVNFTRKIIPPSVRPGETNKDNVVNHFDIFPIGLLFEKRGTGRHNTDTNIDFNVPKRIADWTFGTGGIDGKYADVDGNSQINLRDFDRLKLNLGQSAGTYTPKLSDTISLNTFKFDIPDTVLFASKDSNKLKVPITLIKTGSIPSYGLGFSMQVRHRVETSGQDTIYNKYNYIKPDNGSLWNGVNENNLLFIEDKTSKPNHKNIAYCKTSGSNGDLRDDIGVVEIIVDDILLGKTNMDKPDRMLVSISEVSWIDNNYNTIPIKPVSKYIYFKKETASIASHGSINIAVYPTLVYESIVIENLAQKSLEYTIFNALGQPIMSGSASPGRQLIYPQNWAKGLYYLRLNHSGNVFRLTKE
jgi:hypothetical protein